MNKISNLEASPVYPLVLCLLKKLKEKEVEDNQVEKILEYLVSFYVQRNIVLKPKSSNIRSKAIQIVREIEDETNMKTEIFNVTKKILGEIEPSEQEFRIALESSIYDVSSKTARMILIDIEKKHGNYFNKQNTENLDERDAKKRLKWTLEHILPQTSNLSNEWKVMISPDNIDLASVEQMENMHKLGNLTLTCYNSEMSDKNFIDKRDYKENEKSDYTGLRTGLFINSSIAGENEDIKNKDSWTIDDINRRGKVLAELAMDLYAL